MFEVKFEEDSLLKKANHITSVFVKAFLQILLDPFWNTLTHLVFPRVNSLYDYDFVA